MTSYPTLSDIEYQWRASGSGICIIVEGETFQEDPWFYDQWFGKKARRFTFFPQNGWEKVVDAVSALRTVLGNKRVYGIVDRDFEPSSGLDICPPDGILRTHQYTLENYLLDPEIWHLYVHPHLLRNPRTGWNSTAEIRTTLAGFYRVCLPLSAHNWTLRQLRLQDQTAFQNIPEKDRQYKEHPKALQNLGDPIVHWQRVQTLVGLTVPLAQWYDERLAVLEAMDLAGWQEVVSGKYVLQLLREKFPFRISSNEHWEDVLAAYMYHSAQPPEDLRILLEEVIWRDAQTI